MAITSPAGSWVMSVDSGASLRRERQSITRRSSVSGASAGPDDGRRACGVGVFEEREVDQAGAVFGG